MELKYIQEHIKYFISRLVHNFFYLQLLSAVATNSLILLGSEINRSINNDGIQIWGGNDAYKGGGLQLLGIKNSHFPGIFQLTANDNTNHIMLRGVPDGKLIWNSNDLAGAAIVSKNLTSNNGYITYVTNLTIQYGATNLSGDVTNVTYPISFKTAARISGLAAAENNGYKPIVRLNSYPRINYAPIIKDVNGTFSFYYLVIGY